MSYNYILTGLNSGYIPKGSYDLRALSLEVPLLLVFKCDHHVPT